MLTAELKSNRWLNAGIELKKVLLKDLNLERPHFPAGLLMEFMLVWGPDPASSKMHPSQGH